MTELAIVFCCDVMCFFVAAHWNILDNSFLPLFDESLQHLFALILY